jgi:chromosome segregation ATPase
LQDALEERLSASEEMNKETAEQLERIQLAVKEKEDELASLQNKYDEGLNDALNQINFLKEKEKSLSEANQVFAETICEMEREKVGLYVSTVDIIIAWQGKSSHENNYIFNN